MTIKAEYWLLAVGVTILAYLAIGVLTACGHVTEPKSPEPIVVHNVRVDCITDPPPKPQTPTITGPDGGCPAQFAACLDGASTAKLLLYLSDIQDYADSAWVLCGPDPKTNNNEGE